MQRANSVDTEEAIAARRRQRTVLDVVSVELAEKFPVITNENALEVLDWQEKRIKELTDIMEGKHNGPECSTATAERSTLESERPRHGK